MPSDTAFTTCTCCGSTLLICSRKECAKTFPRRNHEDETSWGSRRYCSLECAAAARQLNRFADRILAEKPCARPGCDKPAKQRRNESPSSFELRKYCSHECSTAVRRMAPDTELEARRKQAAELKAAKAAARLAPKPEPAPRTVGMHPNTSEYTRKSPPRVEPPAPLPVAIPEAPPAPPKPAWRPGLWRELEEAKAR